MTATKNSHDLDSAQPNDRLEAVTVSAAGTHPGLVGGASRLVGLSFRSNGSAGTIALHDGAPGTNQRLLIPTPAAVGWHDMRIPNPGIRFSNDISAVLVQADGLVLTYA